MNGLTVYSPDKQLNKNLRNIMFMLEAPHAHTVFYALTLILLSFIAFKDAFNTTNKEEILSKVSKG